MPKWITAWCCFAALVLITACGYRNIVVLAPDPDGSVGKIRVANAGGSVDISRANQATTVRDLKTAPSPPAQLDPAEVQDRFGR